MLWRALRCCGLAGVLICAGTRALAGPGTSGAMTSLSGELSVASSPVCSVEPVQPLRFGDVPALGDGAVVIADGSFEIACSASSTPAIAFSDAAGNGASTAFEMHAAGGVAPDALALHLCPLVAGVTFDGTRCLRDGALDGDAVNGGAGVALGALPANGLRLIIVGYVTGTGHLRPGPYQDVITVSLSP